ncbi:MAG: hypothetical protein ACLPHI_22105 [Terriglobales bacterium]
MGTEMSDFDGILPAKISNSAIRSGKEWLMPLAQAKEAIDLATRHRIAVLGLEIFRVAQLITEGYSSYEFEIGKDWVEFVSSNNEAAFRYLVEHEFGNGYAYILTTSSAREFEELKTINGKQ